MDDARHGRTTLALAGAAVVLVLMAWVTAGAASLAVALLAAAVAASLVAHESLGPAEAPVGTSVRHARGRGSSSAA
jgi:hypothetical protein